MRIVVRHAVQHVVQHAVQWLARGGVRFGIVVLVASTLASRGDAQTWYTSRSAWQAASSGLTDIDFSGIVPTSPGFVDFADGVPLTVGAVTFTGHFPGASNALSVIDPAAGDPQYDWGSGPLLFSLANYGNGTSAWADAALPAGVRSIGLDVAGYLTDPSFNLAGYGIGVTVSAYDASNNLIASQAVTTLSRPSLAFIGLTSPVPVSSLVLAPNATSGMYAFPLYDNVSFGSLAATAAPEPATVCLLAVGLAGVMTVTYARRRRGEG